MVGIPLQQDERYCAVRAVKTWLEVRSDDTNALFIALDRRCDGARLKPQAVERILEAAAKRAGLMGHFTPHSLHAVTDQRLRECDQARWVALPVSLIGHADGSRGSATA